MHVEDIESDYLCYKKLIREMRILQNADLNLSQMSAHCRNFPYDLFASVTISF
jgi:hypothetical protein